MVRPARWRGAAPRPGAGRIAWPPPDLSGATDTTDMAVRAGRGRRAAGRRL